ncbi:hypothetical protein PY546_19580 [Providencia stuartii]|nr:hypothetical protein [Providencia stuartii]
MSSAINASGGAEGSKREWWRGRRKKGLHDGLPFVLGRLWVVGGNKTFFVFQCFVRIVIFKVISLSFANQRREKGVNTIEFFNTDIRVKEGESCDIIRWIFTDIGC